MQSLEPTAKEYKNAVVMPFANYGVENAMRLWPFLRFFGGVYDGNGVAIPEALLVRNYEQVGHSFYQKLSQAEYQAPYMKPTQILPGKYIFCGPIFPNNFGHFITESLARIWYAKQHPQLPLVWTIAHEYESWQMEILDILEIKNSAIFVQLPTQFESLVVHSVGLVLPDFFTPYYFNALGVIEPKPIIPGKKLYLSRSDLNVGGYTNEKEIESLLAAQGWTIFHPHNHPVKDRFNQISSSEVVLFIEGAVFTSFLFFRNLQSKIFSLVRSESKLFSTEILFNTVIGACAQKKFFNYTCLNIPKKWKQGDGSGAKFELNMDAFYDLMEKTNYLSNNLTYAEKFASYFQQGENSIQSLHHAQSIITTDCPKEREYSYKSVLFENANDIDAAITEIKKAISANPTNSQTHKRLSNLFILKKDFNAAVEAYKKAIQLDEEDHPNFHIQLGNIYAQQNQFDKAVDEAKFAIQFQKDNPNFHHHLGSFLLRKNDLKGAEQAQKTALEFNPDFAQAHSQLGHIYARKNELEKAIEEIKIAIQLQEDNPNFHHHLGNFLLRKNDLEGAEQAQKTALEFNPDFAQAHIQLSHIYVRKNALEKAINEATLAIQLDDDNNNFKNHLNKLLQKKDFLQNKTGTPEWLLNFISEHPDKMTCQIFLVSFNSYALLKPQTLKQLLKDNPQLYQHIQYCLQHCDKNITKTTKKLLKING